MAHTKSQGAAKKTVNIVGKRLGIKKYAGEAVLPGNIIVRQRGSSFHPGKNTQIGRDFTIFATAKGFVSFRRMTGYKRTQKYIDVLPELKAPAAKAEKSSAKTVAKVETKTTKPEAKKVASKPAAKKTTKAKAAKK